MNTKVAITVLAVLALAVSATGFGVAEEQVGVLRPQLTTARSTIKGDAARIKSDAAQIKSDQTLLAYDNSVIGAADEIPPGGYGVFRTSLITSLVSTGDSPAGTSVDCVLPTSWTAGKRSAAMRSILRIVKPAQSTSPWRVQTRMEASLGSTPGIPVRDVFQPAAWHGHCDDLIP